MAARARVSPPSILFPRSSSHLCRRQLASRGSASTCQCTRRSGADTTPPSLAKDEPEPEPIERYSWTGVVHEWVSAPPVRVGATPAQEAAYLEHRRKRRLVEECRHGEYLEMLEHDTEEEVRQAAE
ncbi:putative serine/threonine-protein kinase [Hordeum vulgare]|nr:putative serine/threonine-protein kinase [Hordeum vulgare]